MELDDFIKYAKEKFGCEVSIEKSENPDTFDIIMSPLFIKKFFYMFSTFI